MTRGRPWKKADPALVAGFDAVLPDHPAAQRRTMFGYPACFVNGHYVTGLFEDRIVVRLPGELRDRLPDLADAEPFEPMGTGRGTKDWYVIPRDISDDDDRLAAFLVAAIDEVAKLPPKEPKEPKAEKPRR